MKTTLKYIAAASLMLASYSIQAQTAYFTTISSPQDGTSILASGTTATATIPINVDAYGYDTVQTNRGGGGGTSDIQVFYPRRVEFYDGNTLLGSDSTKPFTYTYNNVLIGAHALTGKSYFADGTILVSSVVTVTVLPPLPSGRAVSVPNYLEYTDVPFGSRTLSQSSRVQEVYDALQFPNGPVVIKELRFRPDSVYGQAFDATVPLEVHLSTTSKQHDQLSMTFAQNTGNDDKTVFNGTAHLSSQFTGFREGGTRDFDIVVKLNPPYFVYTPGAGSNLLVDIRTLSDAPDVSALGGAEPFGPGSDTSSRVVALSPDATAATFSDSGVDALKISYDGLDTCVVPNYLAFTPGPDASGTLRESSRSQQVYDGSQFPSGPVTIQELRFRPAEGSYGRALATTLGNLQINLSTTSARHDNLSTTFAANVGADNTVVFSGPLHVSTQDTGPAGSGPRDFDIVVHLQTPFVYDRSKGNLLLDIRHFSDDTANGPYLGAIEGFGAGTDGGSRAVALDPNAPTAQWTDSAVDALKIIYQGSSASVVPNDLASHAGPDASGTFRESLRSQQVYDGTQFASGPIIIRELRFRPAEAPYGQAFETTLGDIQVNLSTTSARHDQLSDTFADNVGADDTVVVSRGSLHISSQDIGPRDSDGPRDLDIIVPLQKPFIYDPAKGSLLLDIRHYSNDTANGPYLGAVEGFGAGADAGSRVVALDPNSPTAYWQDSAVDALKVIFDPAVADTGATILVSAPSPGATFDGSQPITITASANSRSSTISKIDFFLDDTLIGTVNPARLGANTFTWNPGRTIQAGQHHVSARLTTSIGVAYSAPVLINWNSPLIIVNTAQSDYSFLANHTYYITRPLQFSGVTTINDSAVVKYAPGAKLTVDSLAGSGGVFTSQNDDSCGYTLDNSTHNPAMYDYDTALEIIHDGSTSLASVNIRYAGMGVHNLGPNTAGDAIETVNNVQIANCGYGFYTENNNYVALTGGTFTSTGTALGGYFWGGSVNNITISNPQSCWFNYDDGIGMEELDVQNYSFDPTVMVDSWDMNVVFQ